MYPSYSAATLAGILRLADKHKANIEGMLTWAFEFEDQPYFDGFRTLATNGIDKPVLNFFRMAGMMRGDRVKTESSGAVATDAIVRAGGRGAATGDALPTRADHQAFPLVSNYPHPQLPATPSSAAPPLHS